MDLPDDGSGLALVTALNAAPAVDFVPRLVAAAPGCRTVLDMAAPRAATLAFGADE
jgi:4-hydroxy-tetrahydrodipicolinate reductase